MGLRYRSLPSVFLGLRNQRCSRKVLSPGRDQLRRSRSNTAEGEVSDLTEEENPELTREGLFDVLAGKAKETAGELVGNEALADEGRAQQAEVKAEPEATRQADEKLPKEADPKGERPNTELPGTLSADPGTVLTAP